ncbi:MAG: type II toxin-antitoxin system HicA family toxin [Candidatus Eremiobacterota bacterium]
MKRQALIKHLSQNGCQLLREGSRHSVSWNPSNKRTSSVPRHKEISDYLAYKICKDLDIITP